MRIRPSSPRNRRIIAAALALPLSAALVASLAVPAGAAPAPSENKRHSKTKLDNAIRSSLRAVPKIEGPIPQNSTSYAYNTMKKAKQPYDVATKGYVEEEFFLSGTANVYDLKDGKVVVATKAVPYVNRILVRRPADRAKSSGVVLLDIYNASNGFDVEDHWRRLGDHTMANGDTYIGVTSKPINVDALKNFDPKRYAKLTWNLSGKPDPNRKPLIADPKNPTAFNPHQSIPGTEEGLAWDIITQTGNALRANPKQLLGGQKTSSLLLIGQSQSGIYLNTWTNHFHSLVAKARGKNLFDGYLNSVGARNERPIRQDGKGLAMVPASDAHDFDVPFITVTAEGDYTLFPPGTHHGREDAEEPPPLAGRRHPAHRPAQQGDHGRRRDPPLRAPPPRHGPGLHRRPQPLPARARDHRRQVCAGEVAREGGSGGAEPGVRAEGRQAGARFARQRSRRAEVRADRPAAGHLQRSQRAGLGVRLVEADLAGRLHQALRHPGGVHRSTAESQPRVHQGRIPHHRRRRPDGGRSPQGHGPNRSRLVTQPGRVPRHPTGARAEAPNRGARRITQPRCVPRH